MRKLIWAVLMVGLLFCGWWGVAGWSLRSGITGWFDSQRAAGWQAELAGVSLSGFPGEIQADMQGIALADPETGIALDLDSLHLTARALWPGDVALRLPQTPLGFATPEGRWRLLFDTGRADLNLHPGPALELEALGFTSGPLRVEEATGASLFDGAALELTLTQSSAAAETYAARFDIPEFAPGDVPRAALALPDTWPIVFDALRMSAEVTFDAPLDRATLEDRRPQPVRIDLDRAEARWGDVSFLATGSVVRDAAGFAEGSIVIKAENWQRMIEFASTSGLLPAQYRRQVEVVLTQLARGTGRTNALDITLEMAGGLTRLGFLPVGPAPRMAIR